MSDCAPRPDWDLRAALGRMIGDPLGDGEELVASRGIPCGWLGTRREEKHAPAAFLASLETIEDLLSLSPRHSPAPFELYAADVSMLTFPASHRQRVGLGTRATLEDTEIAGSLSRCTHDVPRLACCDSRHVPTRLPVVNCFWSKCGVSGIHNFLPWTRSCGRVALTRAWQREPRSAPTKCGWRASTPCL